MYRFSFPAFVLTLLLGLFTGSVITAWMHSPPPAPQIVADPGTDVPVVRIEGIRDSALLGTVSGDVRLFAGGELVAPNASGSFAIRESGVLTNIMTIKPPEGMHFVASKRGKKYYPLTSSAAAQIVPQNRIYFPSAQSAQQAGYTP